MNSMTESQMNALAQVFSSRIAIREYVSCMRTCKEHRRAFSRYEKWQELSRHKSFFKPLIETASAINYDFYGWSRGLGGELRPKEPYEQFIKNILSYPIHFKHSIDRTVDELVESLSRMKVYYGRLDDLVTKYDMLVLE